MKRKQQAWMRPSLVHAAVSLALIGGRQALAQNAPPAESPSSGSLQEVVVTASRREESVQDIPYNISVVSGDSLARTGTYDMADLAQQVPGFNYEARGARFAGATVPVMRGLNASDTERYGFTPEQLPVGSYLGNSPVPQGGYLPLIDLNRVEVLRGPQGTLYGAGALGGAIRLIPNEAQLNTWSGDVDATGVDVDHASTPGYIAYALANAPLGSIAAVRLSGQYQYQPGFIDQFGIVARQGGNEGRNAITGDPVLANPSNVANSEADYYDKKNANETTIANGRIDLLLQPSDTLKVDLAGNLAYTGGVNGPQDNPTFAGGPWPVDPRITLPATGPYQIDATSLAPYTRHTSLSSLDVSWDAGFATLATTTSYGDTSGLTGIDAETQVLSFLPAYVAYYVGNPINPRFVATYWQADADHQFSQEFRLVSKSGGALDYVVGLWYQHDRRSLGWQIYEPGTTEQTIASGGLYVNTDSQQRTFVEDATQLFQEKAIYGELTWHVLPRWDMTGGGRFFHQDFTETQSFTTFIYNLTGGNNTTTALSNHIFKLDTTYEFVDQHRVYALFSQGFRRGGANMFPLAGVYQESPQILDYAPDKANNYEFGFKGQFDHALRYTADVFYIDWDNPQIGISTPNYWPVAVNGKKARSQGAELEIHTPVFTPQLDAAIGYTYTDAKLTKSFCLPTGNGTGLPAPAGFDSCGIEGVSGERMPGTAEQDFSGTLTYNQLLSAGKSAVYLVNVNYRGQILNSLGTATNFYRQVYLGGYTVTNISATWPLSTAVTLGLYCTNLLDKRAELAAPERPVAFLGNLANIYTINDPRQVGLRVGYKW